MPKCANYVSKTFQFGWVCINIIWNIPSLFVTFLGYARRCHWQWSQMSVMASQITGNSTVCSTDCSGWQQRKQISTLLTLCEGIHRPLVDSPHKWPVIRKAFPCVEVFSVSWHAASENGFPHIFPFAHVFKLLWAGYSFPLIIVIFF